MKVAMMVEWLETLDQDAELHFCTIDDRGKDELLFIVAVNDDAPMILLGKEDPAETFKHALKDH